MRWDDAINDLHLMLALTLITGAASAQSNRLYDWSSTSVARPSMMRATALGRRQ